MFLTYVPNYVRKIMSVRRRPSCRTHIRSLFSKSCIALLTVSTFTGFGLIFMTDPVVLNASTHRSIVFRPGIAPRLSTLNFQRKRRWTVTTELLFLKKTARRLTHDALRSNAPWLLKLHCLSCPPAHAQVINLTLVLAI